MGKKWDGWEVAGKDIVEKAKESRLVVVHDINFGKEIRLWRGKIHVVLLRARGVCRNGVRRFKRCRAVISVRGGRFV